MTTPAADLADQLDDDPDEVSIASGKAQERNWKQMEKRVKELETENTGLKTEIRHIRFTQAGFPVDDEGNLKGVGKLIAENYDGELTVDKIREYAGTYDIELGGESTGGTVDQAAQIAAAQQRQDRVTAAGRSIPGADTLTQQAEAVRALEVKGGPVTDGEIRAKLDLQRDQMGR